VRIKLKGGTASRVTVDNVEIPVSIIGEPVALNPGKRVIAAKSAEGADARGEINVAERDAKEIELVFSGESPKPVAQKPTSPSSSASSGNTRGASGGDEGPRKLGGFGNDDVDLRPSGERTPFANGLFYGGLGLGVVGITAGAITGVMTLSKASDVEPQCENGICAPSARNDLDSANTLATISTIAFIAGGVGVVAWVVGVFLPPEPSSANPRAGVSWDWRASTMRSRKEGTITIGPTGAGIGGRF
jgi:hypothetical protein